MLRRRKSWQQGMKPQQLRPQMKKFSQPGTIIPGLPYDLALHCLIRVPRMYHTGLRSVCKSWSRLMQSPDFLTARARFDLADPWLLVLLTDLKSPQRFTFCIYDLPSRSLLCRCSIPDSDHRRLIDFKVAALGARLIVVESRSGGGGRVENRTRIFDSVGNRWRSAKNPNSPRSGFAMAAVNGVVFLVGGFNALGEFESATEVYDPSSDSWQRRASMPAEIDGVYGEVVFEGKIFVRAYENVRCVMLVYDPARDLWQEVEVEMSGMEHGELVATESGIFCLTSADRLFRLGRSGWSPVMATICSIAPPSSLNSQRAFGLRDEIFVLGADPSLSVAGDEVACHGLSMGNSWNRAGSIVMA